MTDMAEGHAEDENRREFLYLAAGAVGAVGAASFAWPLIDQMNPAADVLALSTTEVDISGIPEGASITIKWRGQAVFVRHRTPKEIKEAEDVNLSELRDPEPDKDRVEKPQWLIVLGSCTHLGCVPGNQVGDKKGDYGGWFCPCHGSQFDTSGRIRQGPAPTNLAVPPYTFLSDTLVKIG